MKGFDPTSPDTTIINSAPKEILTSNLDSTNKLNSDEFSEIILKTVKVIKDTIYPLCGPNALTNMVIYQQMAGNFNSNVFSNDGIHMLRSLEFMSPIQTYIANYIKYISDRVEAASADGTSTAIILACDAITDIMNYLRSPTEIENPKCGFNKALAALIKSPAPEESLTDIKYKLAKRTTRCASISFDLDRTLEALQHINIDLTRVPLELRDKLIYNLAFTTSKGNTTLSQFAVDIFSNIPPSLYGLSTYRREQLETDTPLKIEYKEHDVAVSVMPSSNSVYNHNLFTEIAHEDCAVLVIPEFIDQLDYVIEATEALMASKKYSHVVILAQQVSQPDEVVITTKFSPKDVTLCFHTNYSKELINNPLELMIILASADKDYKTPESVEDLLNNQVIENIDAVVVNSNELRLSHLYTCDTDYQHPLFKHRTNPFYNKLVKDIETRISQLKGSHNATNSKGELGAFMKLYKLLVCFRLPILVIGGTTTEHLANVNVIDDVNGVVSVSMKEGVIIDMLPKLYHILSDTSVLKTSVRDLAKFVYHDRCDIEDNITGRFSFINGYGQRAVSVNDPRTLLEYMNDTTESAYKLTSVQSFKSIHETIRRLKETIPKLASVDQIIVPHSVAK